MLYPLIGIGLLFIGIGYLVNEKNAKYLLSGYNTMPSEQQKKIQIEPYISFFRKFHLFLGLSYIGVGIILNFVSANALGLFLGVYPIFGYLYFIWKSKPFFNGIRGGKYQIKISLTVLVLSLVFVGFVFYLGYRKDEIYLKNNQLVIEGFYGEEIVFDQIKSIELIPSLPKIKERTNGFSAGSVHKGHFKTKDGKRIKLIINGTTEEYILITTNSGSQIYYASPDIIAEEILSDLKQKIKTSQETKKTL